ncbi:nuclear transport factor 2 family protein [Pseudomonas sp. MF6755]|uniref:nuclear transport factor 2 family protein n=1 Tax=Pseudomonas sp. MF6755 TaxID=2797530 RepID=UPI0018E80400|nr:nuclear transport factor 2 family protein [Pseudomonas sp. MF6755]MBJ2285845.1 nuclear transport factor 2 family protein [Pseudomonas sp. MF6755]
MTETPIDYDGLMQANLKHVFGEHDENRRIKAIRIIYAKNAVLNEPHTRAKGQHAISDAIAELLASLPRGFVFRAKGPAVGHNGLGRLSWTCGPREGPAAVTGMDIAHFKNGRIESLFVFVDPISPDIRFQSHVGYSL